MSVKAHSSPTPSESNDSIDGNPEFRSGLSLAWELQSWRCTYIHVCNISEQHFRTCMLSKSSIINLLLSSSLKLVVKMSSIYNPILNTQLIKLAGLVLSDLCSFIDRQKVFSLTTVVSLPSDRCKKLSPQKLSPGMLRWLLRTNYVPLIDDISWK